MTDRPDVAETPVHQASQVERDALVALVLSASRARPVPTERTESLVWTDFPDLKVVPVDAVFPA